MTENQTAKDVVNTVKKVTLVSNVDFCDLPTEDTQTSVPKNESNKLKNDLNVVFTRVNTKQVYGSKKEKVDVSKENIAKIGTFLETFYTSSNTTDDEDNIIGETFEEWRNRLTLQRVQILLMTRAKTTAISNEKLTVETFQNQASQMLDSGKLDISAIEAFEKMLAEKKAEMLAAAKK